MSRIYWDSMIFIYLLEDHPVYAERVKHIRERMIERSDVLCTSTFTVAELLTGAKKRGDNKAALAILDLFRGPAVETVPFTMRSAEIFAEIRARYGVSPPDAIHLSCAGEAETDVFLTNDASLVGKMVPGIQFIAKMDTTLF
jgi:predicted nucleic acid-binding protein